MSKNCQKFTVGLEQFWDSPFSYPYLLLSIRAGLQGIDPAMEEAARSLGHGRRATFFGLFCRSCAHHCSRGLLVVLNALQDFGTTSLMRFDAFTRVIFLQYRYTLTEIGQRWL